MATLCSANAYVDMKRVWYSMTVAIALLAVMVLQVVCTVLDARQSMSGCVHPSTSSGSA